MNDKSFNLASFLSKLTSEPGVYRMLDEEGRVLYIGKASNLKKRVSSYFNKQNNAAKTRSLVSQIKAIDVSITRSETEALLLESNLIKVLQPKYNILMRDDKSYPYIFVSAHPFPRIELYRSKKKPQKGEFYGPFPSVSAVRETLNFIQKTFKIRNCTDSFFSVRSRPCLQYQIKRCSAPCTEYISKEAYSQSLQDARLFLQGKSQLIIDELAKRMNEAVNQLAFEEAAILRDQIKNLRLTQEQQAVASLSGDADVIAIEARPGFASVQCVSVREGNIIATHSFFPTVPTLGFDEEDEELDLWERVFETFVAFHYVPTPSRIPKQIISHRPIKEQKTIEAMLTELAKRKCQIQINPSRGDKVKWLDFALNNLKLAIAERMSSADLIESRFHALQQTLGFTKPIQRMECFDISHTQGEATVASCVVFDKEGPCTSLYRRFNISGITPGDDYAAMEQAIRRRFKRLKEEQNFPDLLIIDGGKGQIAVAKTVLESLGINEVYILGIVKGEGRKPGFDRLLLVYEAKELNLTSDSKALHLIQHIRDEAHRFAINAHRKKRQKTGFESSLEAIEGIGPKRRKALLQRFGGIRDLAKAPLEEIAKVGGISKEMAERIFNHFHP